MNHLIHIAAHMRLNDEALFIDDGDADWLLVYPTAGVPGYCVVGEDVRVFIDFPSALNYICAKGLIMETQHA